MDIAALLASHGTVPSVPRVTARLLTELEQPAPRLAQIKRFVAADPGLTCRVLQLANAAGAGAPGQVPGTAQAVERLGVAGMEPVAQAVAAASSFVVPGLNMRQFWRVSLNAAKVGRSLADRIGIDPAAAFTAGMIHGVGEVFMQRGMPDEMAILNKRVAPFKFGRAKAEDVLFGYSYALVAAEFARKWNFPRSLVVALRDLPLPYRKDAYDPLVGVLHLAVWRARAYEANFTQAQYAAHFPYEIALALGLDIDMVLKQEPVDWRSTNDIRD